MNAKPTYAIPGKWADQAACAGSTQLMISTPGRAGSNPNAIELCNSCPVIQQCREWALTKPDPALGLIAGGMTYRQRIRARRVKK